MAPKKWKLPEAPASTPSSPKAGSLVAVVVAALVVVGGFIWYQQVGQRAPAPTLPSTTGMELGPPNAPVTVEEFADFQCPSCKAAQSGTVHRLQADALAEGSQFRLVFRNFAFLGAESQRLAEGGVCAAAQGRFGPYAEKMYDEQRPENSGYMTRDRIVQYAVALGLDQAKFATCLDQGQAKPAVAADIERGKSLGVHGTPTFAINGKAIVNGRVPSYDDLKQAIAAAATAAPAR